MAYTIEQQSGFVEIKITGKTSKFEALDIIANLARMDPDKTVPDLWTVAPESQVPLVHFPDIVEAVIQLLPKNTAPSRTALLVSDAFQNAKFELYRAEADSLPFSVRIFWSRDEAVEWLTGDESRIQ